MNMFVRFALAILLSALLGLYLQVNFDWLMVIHFSEAVQNTIARPVPPKKLRTLMPAGTFITAQTPRGNISIEWLNSSTRRYSWQTNKGDWSTSTENLIPTENGGVYLPGNRSQDLATFFGLKPNFMIAEYEKTGTISELQEWLRDYIDGAGTVYTHDGLVVRFLPDQPEIDVVQLRAADSTHLNLAGAKDESISVSLKNSYTEDTKQP